MTSEDIRKRLKFILQTRHTSLNRLASGNSALQRKLQRQINEDAAITADTLLHVIDTFPDLSANWLLTGTGEPFANSNDSTVIEPDNSCIIPVYSVEASANLDTLQVGGPESEHIIGTVKVPNVPKCDGATYVRGDSMYPLLQSGDLIGFKMLPVSRDSIFFGEIYLLSLDVEGDRYLSVKYIQPSDKGEQYIKLVSANPNHLPKDVHLNTVRSLALVKFTIRMNSML